MLCAVDCLRLSRLHGWILSALYPIEEVQIQLAVWRLEAKAWLLSASNNVVPTGALEHQTARQGVGRTVRTCQERLFARWHLCALLFAVCVVDERIITTLVPRIAASSASRSQTPGGSLRRGNAHVNTVRHPAALTRGPSVRSCIAQESMWSKVGGSERARR